MRRRAGLAAICLLAATTAGCGETPPAAAPAAPSKTTTATSATTTMPAVAPGAAAEATLVVEELPPEGFVVVDGERLVVVDDDGRVVADGASSGFWSNDHATPMAATVAGRVVTIQEVPRAPFVATDLPDDCRPQFVGGAPNVARCGPSEAELRRIDVTDTEGHRTLVETPPGRPGGQVLGHWASVLLSPDGRWVLAQWSGECESPATFVFPLGEGRASTVDGTALASWADAPSSVPAGWTADGRARFVVGAGACGAGLEARGVYAAAPGSKPSLLYRAAADYPVAYAWRAEPTAR